MSKLISTIIFDLSEVYLNGLYGSHLRLSKKIKKEIDDSAFFVPEMRQYFEGRILEDQYLNALIIHNKWPIDLKNLKATIRNNFREIEGTRKIIERLKTNGYQLGLLSVHGKEWISHCEEKFDYHKLFDSIVYSFEIGVCKPEKKAYLSILKKLGKEPSECLFIDDMEENLLAAREIGMNTILFTTSKQLVIDLKGMGIKA